MEWKMGTRFLQDKERRKKEVKEGRKMIERQRMEGEADLRARGSRETKSCYLF